MTKQIDGKLPLTRSGMIQRELLRTNKLVATDLDLLLKEHIDARHKTTTHGKQNPSHYLSKSTKFVFPRVLILDQDHTTERTHLSSSRTVEPIETVTQMKLEDDLILDYERPYFEECEPIVEPEIHPTCNSLHEVQLDAPNNPSLLSTRGSWRIVWKVDFEETLESNMTALSQQENRTVGTTDSAVVLKTLHLHREFDPQSFRAHNTDVMVMERLTASPFVVDAYGFCGQSVLTEYASSSGRDYIKRYDVRNKERLRMVRDLAFGLADIQALRPLDHSPTQIFPSNTVGDTPVFAHNDINIANVVAINGKIKWNDFNIGELLRRKGPTFNPFVTVSIASSNESTTKNDTDFTPFLETNSNYTICPAPVRYRSDLWRSPEEIRNISYVRAELSDMYGFGNILYQTLTRHQPWTHKEPGGKLETRDVRERKLEGLIPAVPEQYLNATTRDVQIMFVATMSCYDPEPINRPSAIRLAKGLGLLYDRLKNKTKVSRKDILDYILPSRAKQ
ncbi:protein kinase domain containing protein [Nitzschia inconspicua]|uniref:Protein kinase domain containing protein n=1 Tax=Nitzschia inconspicua TaxID=303405 RepID=A0A9K3LSV8_9STRA|nr:protein kinase domain containing protein [Nitzschia inconspicua]